MQSFLENRFARALLGNNCVLCGSTVVSKIFPVTHHCATSDPGDFCTGCRKSLPDLPSGHCSVCAVPVSNSTICGACLADAPAFEQSIAAFEYAFPIDALLQSLKYRSNLAMARTLADLLSAKIMSTNERATPPECIVPMPLHPVRLRERGFNQAVEIARRVSKNTGVPLLADACQRIRDTPSQTHLPWKAREKNIRGAFACRFDFSGKHVAILDDVMTTGASVNELAKLLRNHGAMRVSAWVVARTLPDRFTLRAP